MQFYNPFDLTLVTKCPINKIAFCVITNSKKEEKTLITLKSIKRACDSAKINYEIIIAGITEKFKHICDISIEMADEANSARVSSLRNACAHAAGKHSNVVCFCDDDIVLPQYWGSRLLEFNEKKPWAVLSNRIILPDGGRCWDRATLNPHRMVNYDHDEYDKNLYQTSGFFLMKKDVFEKFQWNEKIGWYAEKNGGVNEDVELSMRLVSSNYPLSFDPNNLVWHWDDSYINVLENKNLICLKKSILQNAGIEVPPAIELQNFKNDCVV